MLFILSLFLLCGIVFTLFLVAITVRDARRIAGRELTEKEKDRIALEFARPEFASAVTSCCDCEAGGCNCDGADGKEEPSMTDLTELLELRRQVKQEHLRCRYSTAELM